MAILRGPHSILASIRLFFALSATAHAACFLPNGTDINKLRSPDSDIWQACDLKGHSMCCRTKGDQPDKCQPNGLCHNDVAPILWRESCTDPTWKAPACLQLCNGKNAVNVGNPNFPDGTPLVDSHSPITKCPDGSFCCGVDAFNCCSSGKGVYIQSGTVVSTKPTSTPTDSSDTSASTGTGTTTTTSSRGNSGGGSTNTGAIVGGTLGGVAVGALIVAGLFFAWRHRKRQQNSVEARKEYPWPWRHEPAQPNAVSELPGSSVPELGHGGSTSINAEPLEAAGREKPIPSPNTQSSSPTPVSFYRRMG